MESIWNQSFAKSEIFGLVVITFREQERGYSNFYPQERVRQHSDPILSGFKPTFYSQKTEGKPKFLAGVFNDADNFHIMHFRIDRP